MPRIDVLDISHYQTVISFEDIKAAGVIGIIHKATEGTSYVDDYYVKRQDAALAAGLRWGAYHFLKHGSADAQMEHFLDTAELAPGSRVAIDYEDKDCTLDDLAEALEAIGQLDPSMQVCIYGGSLLKEQVGKAVYDWLMPYPLWLAQYTSGEPTWPKQIWPHWTLWQFSDGGIVNGVSAPVDVNTFNGSPENCARWMGPVAVPTEPVELTEVWADPMNWGAVVQDLADQAMELIELAAREQVAQGGTPMSDNVNRLRWQAELAAMLARALKCGLKGDDT
jgi:lysozyme